MAANEFLLVIDNGDTEEVYGPRPTLSEAKELFQEMVRGRNIFNAKILKFDEGGNIVRTHVPEMEQ